MKKTVSIVLISLLALLTVLTGCRNAGLPENYKIVMLAAQNSLDDPVMAGLLKFSTETEIGVVQASGISAPEADAAIDELAKENYRNVIINNSSLANESVAAKAAAYPDATFVCMYDTGSLPQASNIVGANVKAEESAFLAGYTAAKKTQSGSVGLVTLSGGNAAAIERGFRAGIVYAHEETGKDIGLGVARADVLSAEEQAVRLYNAGNDIVFVAVPGSQGERAALAAKEQGKLMISLGDMSVTAPDNMLLSVICDYEAAAYDIASKICREQAAGGQTFDYGINEGYTGYIKNDASSALLGDDLVASLDEIVQKIKDGAITI